tara:strand:+ start:182 stop:1357 length:1176 start_codon:yes stop_codon:yes gene_type:complete
MSEWTIKGAVEGEETSETSREQEVLDKAVESGDIAPEAAGVSNDEVPKIVLDDSGQLKDVTPSETPEEATEPTVEPEIKNEETEVVEDDSPLELVNDEEEVSEPKAVVEEAIEPVQNVVPQIELPENVDKLVKFMEETGGSVEDYVLLNRDLEAYDDGSLLREYYKQSKPWDGKEVDEYMEDNFSYDDDDDPRDIRSKKRAFKEELHNAKRFLEGNKEKYYADIKLNKQNDIPQEYQQAFSAQTEYQKSAESTKKATESFLQKTSDVFNEDFKGFDFQVGSDKYRFKVGNPAEVKTQQSDINNFVGDFLGEDGQINNAKGYHKALFAARNADKLAEHFYEQGRADALRKSAKDAKNIKMDPRQEGTVKAATGQKFKVVSGDTSSKLKMRLR